MDLFKKKGVSKYLVFDSVELYFTDENKELLKKYTGLWNRIKYEIEEINRGK